MLLTTAVVVSFALLLSVVVQPWAAKSTGDAFRLRRIHLATGIVHLLSSTALAWLAVSEEPWKAPVHFVESSWKYSNTTANQTSCSGDLKCYSEFRLVEGPMKLEVAVLSVLFGLISGVGHMVSAYFPEYSLAAAECGFNPIRWADYSLSASLMIIVLSAICGVTEGYTLVLVALLQCSLLLVRPRRAVFAPAISNA